MGETMLEWTDYTSMKGQGTRVVRSRENWGTKISDRKKGFIRERLLNCGKECFADG